MSGIPTSIELGACRASHSPLVPDACATAASLAVAAHAAAPVAVDPKIISSVIDFSHSHSALAASSDVVLVGASAVNQAAHAASTTVDPSFLSVAGNLVFDPTALSHTSHCHTSLVPTATEAVPSSASAAASIFSAAANGVPAAVLAAAPHVDVMQLASAVAHFPCLAPCPIMSFYSAFTSATARSAGSVPYSQHARPQQHFNASRWTQRLGAPTRRYWNDAARVALLLCCMCIVGVAAAQLQPSWSTAVLSAARGYLAATSLPNQGLAVFAGGQYTGM
jgi:hypothetical protein